MLTLLVHQPNTWQHLPGKTFSYCKRQFQYSKMSGAKVLITDPVDAVCANYLIKNGCHVDQIKLTKEQLLENIKVCDVFFSLSIFKSF